MTQRIIIELDKVKDGVRAVARYDPPLPADAWGRELSELDQQTSMAVVIGKQVQSMLDSLLIAAKTATEMAKTEDKDDDEDSGWPGAGPVNRINPN